MNRIRQTTLNTVLATAALAVAAAGLAGCDVRKTKDGNVTVPKYEVTKTQEGSVTVPEYKVTPPDVTVGSKQTDVTVPKVTTEEKTVTVPTIDVKTGKEKAAEQGK